MGEPVKKALDPLGILGGGDTVVVQTSSPAPVVPIEPVKTMPTPDDDAAKAARRRSLVTQTQRRGRASTILADETETLG